MLKRRNYIAGLCVAGALLFAKLAIATYTLSSVVPTTDTQGLHAEVGSSDSYATGWTWVEWQGSSTLTQGGTDHYSSGSWHADEIWSWAVRSVIDTGRLHSSSTEPYGFSKIQVPSTSIGGAVARLLVNANWPGDPF